MHVLVHDEREQLVLARAPKWRQSLATLHADRLDRQLARGIRPESDLLLAVRAMQLTSARMREQLAASLGLVAFAGRPRVVPARNRAALAEAADSLGELSDALLSAGPVPARGVAMVILLLSDGTGPLYRRSRAAELGVVISQAIQALTPSWPVVTYP
jgi:hypothetical protein